MIYLRKEIRLIKGLLSFCFALLRLEIVANIVEGASELCMKTRVKKEKEFKDFGRNFRPGVLGLLKTQKFTAMFFADDQSEKKI